MQITVTNEPVPGPSTASFTFSLAKYFLFSTSWKYWRVPICLKTLNPNLKGYAAKYRYQKCQTQEIKTISAKNECNSVNFGVVTKFKFRYSIVRFLLVWLNQLTGLHPPLHVHSIEHDFRKGIEILGRLVFSFSIIAFNRMKLLVILFIMKLIAQIKVGLSSFRKFLPN